MVLRQQTPSIWMAFAVLQSAFWLFGLPRLLQSVWNDIFFGRSPIVAETFLNLAYFVTFVVCKTFVVLLYWLRLPFLEQYKISDKQWPWESENEKTRAQFWALSSRSVGLLCLNWLVVLPILTVSQSKLFPDGVCPLDVSEWPSHMEMIRDNGALMLLQQFGYYWTHRLLHSHRTLYRFHKVHHEYRHNTVLAGQHLHPIDFVFANAGPALLALMIVQPHGLVRLQFGIFLVFLNVDDHCGYAFPWSPIRWFPVGFYSTEQHEFHHEVNEGCFASCLNLWDRIFHTEGTYRAWLKKQWEGAAKTV